MQDEPGGASPYLNFHRPCGVPERVFNAKGKEKRMYRWYATPWQILGQLPDLARHLKPDITIENLDRQASASSDTEAAGQIRRPGSGSLRSRFRLILP